MTRHDKLVRDRIPEIIAAAGHTADVRTLDAAEFHDRLIAKLAEETAEYATDRSPDELADILEVVAALAATHGLTWGSLLAIRDRKRRDRGGFDRRLLLVGTAEPGPDADPRPGPLRFGPRPDPAGPRL